MPAMKKVKSIPTDAFEALLNGISAGKRALTLQKGRKVFHKATGPTQSIFSRQAE